MARATRQTTYQCINPRCKKTLVWDDFASMQIPPVLECPYCGAGRKMTMQQQYEKRQGMFPVNAVPSIHEVHPQGSQPS